MGNHSNTAYIREVKILSPMLVLHCAQLSLSGFFSLSLKRKLSLDSRKINIHTCFYFHFHLLCLLNKDNDGELMDGFRCSDR
ncbi:hypothetical protein Nmel_005725 [Mimus melanotis]